MVVAVFNTRLGEHFRRFFTDCTVLSGTAQGGHIVVAGLGNVGTRVVGELPWSR